MFSVREARGLTICAVSYAQTIVPPGEVNGTWAPSGSPYLITGDIGIPAGQLLTVEPGVKVEFQGHFKFEIQGQLLAVGNEYDTIRFTINDTTGFHDINIPDGGWHGLRFGYSTPGDDTSAIGFCRIEYGKAVGNTDDDRQGGAIAIKKYPNLVIFRSVFYQNAAYENGGAIAVSDADITLEKSIFYKNKSSTGSGGGIAVVSADVSIKKCAFFDNRAGNSGGAVSFYLNSGGEITTNMMAGNFADYGGAIQLENSCNPVVRNNLIYSNVADEEGGGADMELNCQPTFINNTITGNYALFGGGIDVELNTSPAFRNDIIWGNTAFVDGNQIHLFSEDSDPDFYYCDLQGGRDSIGTWDGGYEYTYNGTYENNMNLNPDFIDTENYNFLLKAESPCVDAGDPDEQYNDIEDTDNPGYALWPSMGTVRNDMGSFGGPYAYYYYYILTGIHNPAATSVTNRACILFQNVPNPARDITTISYRLPVSGHTLLSVYDMQGKEIVRLVNRYQARGLHSIRFDIQKYNLPPGIYLCRLQTGNSYDTGKLIIY